MKNLDLGHWLVSVGLTMLGTFCSVLGKAQNAPPGARLYDNIPNGKVTEHVWKSTIYQNTIREYQVYVPAQYDGSEPAALMVFQDGHTYAKEDGDFRVPTVFDNLIAQGRMPVTIGLFINPGHDQDQPAPETPWRANNRSNEYDTLSDTYSNFLIDEMIPLLKDQYVISDDPKMHAICGISSGGICAFTAAWERPDVFHKVLSHIGSFTNIKGGHHYPALIRSSEAKPMKVFLQDGSNDLDNRFGNWFLANQQMAKALAFKDYNYKFVADDGAHNGEQGGLILAQSLTWLWDDVVPSRLESNKYSVDRNRSDLLFAGETTHLSHIECRAENVSHGNTKLTSSSDHEQVLIIQSGSLTVAGYDGEEELGANSVLFIPAGGWLEVFSERDISFLKISMKSRSPKMDAVPSEAFVINFDSLSYRSNLKGGRRDCFNRSTSMFPYFEMHITTLKPGIQSHPAHTHDAEEMIIMIDGQTEEEIGNQVHQGSVGDVYFLGANVPHSIRNVGDEMCSYFAFQWR